MKTNMILSASGWRKVFAITGEEQDHTKLIGKENEAISIFSAKAFASYVKNKTNKDTPRIVLGMDARPTGEMICCKAIKAFLKEGVDLVYIGITAAPEIMAYSRGLDGFMYVSASHNPIGHNGIKFGLNTGGVLNGEENAKLTKDFLSYTDREDAVEYAESLIKDVSEEDFQNIISKASEYKKEALSSYTNFLKLSITGFEDKARQEVVFDKLRKSICTKNIGVVCDMNGSARSDSVDKSFFSDNKVNFYTINYGAGNIVHEIIPESENLVHVASEMERLQKEGKKDAVLGYMPDCDGDRGNIVYWDNKSSKSVILKAQEVFSLSVLAELSYAYIMGNKKLSVAVNCPTSMRIEEIARCFKASVFRAEVGEANVVNLAEAKRKEGYFVPLCGEGSNGGTITYPSAVRDPINTIFAILKLLSMKEMYKAWCDASGAIYKEDYNLTDILESLPKYTTTGVSEKRAVLKVNTLDHGTLKAAFQKEFENWYKNNASLLHTKYGIVKYEGVITKGITETRHVEDWSLSGKGGLKVLFFGEDNTPIAFIWMRGSGTEPVFRVMCDVKGDNPSMEKDLLQIETDILRKADK